MTSKILSTPLVIGYRVWSNCKPLASAIYFEPEVDTPEPQTAVMTFRDVAELYLSTLDIQTDTLYRYRHDLPICVSTFGDRDITTITKGDIRRWQQASAEGDDGEMSLIPAGDMAGKEGSASSATR